MKKFIYLMLFLSACSKPEVLKPTEDLIAGHYELNVISQRAQVVWSIQGERQITGQILVWVQDSTLIDVCATYIGDEIYCLIDSENDVLINVFRNDTLIETRSFIAPKDVKYFIQCR